MSLLLVVVCSAAVLLVAYRTYGSLLSRWLQLDPERPTPAVELRDDIDYLPIAPKFLLSQHFSAIAAAGPIVGPITAGVMFGWAPALAWILLGCIFIGGMHDLGALIASVRHQARSIAEVVEEYMSRRAYLLFLAFIWIALVYIIVTFTDITASSFVNNQTLENGEVVEGAAIASSSLMYLALPIIMGLLLRFARLSLLWATVIFVPLVGAVIYGGQFVPFDLGAILGLQPAAAIKAWDTLLLIYCYLAAIAPMWLLLQPRGHLGGFFLYFALGGGALGLMLCGEPVRYPAFTSWVTAKGETLAPMLFITIACGACSGFHSLIASGTTSKQLRRETDARVIGYGAMLLEGMVAVVSLSCVMLLAAGDPSLASVKPNFIYAQGIARFLSVFGIPEALGVTFALMAFTTFVYDTLDVCTRLGRYVLQELLGRQDKLGRFVATAATAGAPLVFLLLGRVDPATGAPVPVWKSFWSLFGASNQLLAAMGLLGVTVWLLRTRKARWIAPACGLPTAFMYVMSVWALVSMAAKGFRANLADPVPWVASILVILALLLLVEGIKALAKPAAVTSG